MARAEPSKKVVDVGKTRDRVKNLVSDEAGENPVTFQNKTSFRIR